MVRTTVVAIAILACAAAAQAADYELKWDNGVMSMSFGGSVNYYGHDFDLTNYNPRSIKYIRVYSSGLAYNGQWDGFDVALFDFTNGYPGELLWGPTFVIGSGSPDPRGHTWCDFPVGYTLPTGKTKVIATMTNHDNAPNVDPICVADSPPQHQWWRSGANQWARYESTGNIMIRLIVSDNVGIAPASLGRVKALYE